MPGNANVCDITGTVELGESEETGVVVGACADGVWHPAPNRTKDPQRIPATARERASIVGLAYKMDDRLSTHAPAPFPKVAQSRSPNPPESAPQAIPVA